MSLTRDDRNLALQVEPAPPSNRPRWDIFCRVVDNYGDMGVCWRLARQLSGEHHIAVRLWIDDIQAFACFLPVVATDQRSPDVGSLEVRHWCDSVSDVEWAALATADVVIEAFACELPESYLAGLANRSTPPVWINLEYLCAENWVDECHGLKSPHPKFPLTKWFFFPGFTNRTGGLIREKNLRTARGEFDAAAATRLLNQIGVTHPDEHDVRVSLFCYGNPALPTLLRGWSDGPTKTLLLVTAGQATDQVAGWLGRELVPGEAVRREALTLQQIPFLTQPDYDRLLWSCDVNFVRGEDSFVRAQWAERPFVWQIYPQSEAAHVPKLTAFLDRYLADCPNPCPCPDEVASLWHAWNGLAEPGMGASAWQRLIPSLPALKEYAKVWASHLDQQLDLANNLVRFVCDR